MLYSAAFSSSRGWVDDLSEGVTAAMVWEQGDVVVCGEGTVWVCPRAE